MSGCRCQCGSSRTMSSRRCADEGGGLRLQFPALGLALARAAGEVLAARSRVSVDVPGADLAYTWRGPSTYPGAPGRPPVPGPAAGRGGSAVPQPEPGHRPPAASPPPHRAASPATSPSPSPRPSSASPPQARSCGTPGPPRSVTSTRITPPAARTATVTVSPCSARAAVPDAVGEQLAHHQRGVIPARVPRPGHPGRERPGNPGPLRPPGRRHALPETALATSAPAFPGPPRGPGNHRGPRPGTRGCTPGSAARVEPGYAAGAARPWPSVKQPTVRTDRDGARIPSAMRPWTPRHVDPQ